MKLGASYAEARCHRLEGTSITTKFGGVISYGEGLSEGIGVLVRGAPGFSATNPLS